MLQSHGGEPKGSVTDAATRRTPASAATPAVMPAQPTGPAQESLPQQPSQLAQAPGPAPAPQAARAPGNVLAQCWQRLTRGVRTYVADRPWQAMGPVLPRPTEAEQDDLQRRAMTLSLLAVPFVFVVMIVSLLDDPPVATLATVMYALPFLAITWWMLDEPSAQRSRVGATLLTSGSVVLVAVLSFFDGFGTTYWMAVVVLAACNILTLRAALTVGAFALAMLVGVAVALALTDPFAPTMQSMAALMGRRVAFVAIFMAFGIGARRLMDRHVFEVRQQRELIEVQAHALAHEVAQRKQVERELKRSLGLVTTNATDGVITYASDGMILEANQAASDILGLGPADLCGRSLPGLLRGQDPALGTASDLVAKLTMPGARLEFDLGAHLGPARATEWAISARQVSERLVYLAIVRDVTDQKRLEAELYHRANYNAATGLPKRQLFTKNLDDVVRAEGTGVLAGVFAVGLDDFGIVQDAFGYDFGQEVLRVIGARLAGLVADRGEVGAFDRVGLLVWVRSGATAADLMQLARRIQQTVSEPIELSGNRVSVTASIGLSTPAHHHRSPGGVSREAKPSGGGAPPRAERGVEGPERPAEPFSACAAVNQAGAALSRGRQIGREVIQLHDDGMQSEARRTAELDHALRLALPNGEFRLFFQPVVSIRSGEVVSAEALLRWERPGVGLVSPAEFLPRLEASGLIVSVGEWVIDEACAQLAAWHRRIAAADPMARLPRVNVNLSAIQFASADLAPRLADAVERYGLAPGDLVLEVTESTAFDPRYAAEGLLSDLRDVGYLVAIDDFGTGYSSLNKIIRVNVDVVKLDKSYVEHITADERDRALVAGILAVCRRLGLRTVAEGVETVEQLELLREMGCDRVQGYLLARPTPAETSLAVPGPAVNWQRQPLSLTA